MAHANDGSRTTESFEEMLNCSAEDLITGDADDPPLGEETVLEMLKITQITRRSAL